jgi:hypothetical protein
MGTTTGKRLIRIPSLAAVTLALIAARALVPAGFMFMPVGGGVELRFCGGTLHAHGATHPAADASCPYAQSAGPAPPPSLPPILGERPLGARWDARALPQTTAQFGPPRRPASRGPPIAA